MNLSRSFHRSQVAALAATVVDFGSLVLLVEFVHVWYVAATAMGAFFGAVTNFLLGRHWAFHPGAPERLDDIRGQARRYALVSAGSLALNTLGVYLFTDIGGLRYIASKATVAILISVFFNFPLQRAFVFR